MKKILASIISMMMVISLAGCSSSSPAPSGDKPTENKSSGKPTRMLLGTSSAGGTYYTLGGAWAKIMNANAKNVDIAVEVTGGPNTNIQLIQKGEMELGYVTTWLGGEAFSGEGWAKGTKYNEIRGMYPMYSSVLYIYTLKSKGITSIRDLEGKNVSVGAPGSTSDLAGRAVLETLGIKPKSISSLPSDTQVNSLKDGTMDANFGVTGLPAPWLLDLETTHEVQYIPLSQEDMSKILKAYPYWAQGVVPDKTYKHQKGDIPVITFWNMAVCDKDLSEDVVYDLVKTTFDHQKELVAVDPTSKSTIPENVTNCTVPLHPGALKYYKEKGITVPDNLILK